MVAAGPLPPYPPESRMDRVRPTGGKEDDSEDVDGHPGGSSESFFRNRVSESESVLVRLLAEDGERDGFGRERQRSRYVRYFSVLMITLVTLTLVALVVRFLAWHGEGRRRGKGRRFPITSNGTHDFGPTTIVVSVDGMRADYLDRGVTPTLNRLAMEGIRARYMTPAFPSTTFPNHYSIVTGLYPESHGIVGNDFWDPALNDSFNYTDPKRSWDSKWWGGEPIWVTAVRQGLRSAVCMWPGSSAVIRGTRPTYDISYNSSVTTKEKVAQVLRWLNEPDIAKRPNFIAMYIQSVDKNGHEYGPDSPQVDQALAEEDAALGGLVGELERRNLTDIVNLIVLSDHGMSTATVDKLVYLEDWMDVRLIRRRDGYPLGGLWLADDVAIPEVYRNLSWVDGKSNKHFQVYYRENVPARFHYSHNQRIAPIAIIPEVGHVVVADRKEHPSDKPYRPLGMHGWDNEHQHMRASFVARGPDFVPVKLAPAGEVNFVPPFRNTEVYELLCWLLYLDPKPNNGTLGGRLPGVRS